MYSLDHHPHSHPDQLPHHHELDLPELLLMPLPLEGQPIYGLNFAKHEDVDLPRTFALQKNVRELDRQFPRLMQMV